MNGALVQLIKNSSAAQFNHCISFSMRLGIKNVLRANHVISLIINSTTDPRYFKVLLFYNVFICTKDGNIS
jgi:hypothetical protein